jgi:hypothetical protein
MEVNASYSSNEDECFKLSAEGQCECRRNVVNAIKRLEKIKNTLEESDSDSITLQKCIELIKQCELRLAGMDFEKVSVSVMSMS